MVNPLQNKVTVVSPDGTLGIGMMDPQVGMRSLTYGYLTSIVVNSMGASGQVVAGGQGVTGVFTLYTPQFHITSGDAAAFGWPGGADCVQFGHGKVPSEAFYTNNGNPLNTTWNKVGLYPFTYINAATSGIPVTPIVSPSSTGG